MITTPFGEYLRARRALLRPVDVGLVDHRPRRVAGLRRDEVARAAGISAEYYVRLEQGRDRQPSDQVVTALGRALRLDRDAVEHMRRLARLGSVPSRPEYAVEPADGPALRALVGQWDATPAYVMTRNHDVVLANPLAETIAPRRLRKGANLVLDLFLADRVRDDEWLRNVRLALASLRWDSDPRDPRLAQIVEELSSDAVFRDLWSRHDVVADAAGHETHPVGPVARVRLRRQVLYVPGAQPLMLVVLHADGDLDAAAAVQALRRSAPAEERAADLNVLG